MQLIAIRNGTGRLKDLLSIRRKRRSRPEVVHRQPTALLAHAKDLFAFSFSLFQVMRRPAPIAWIGLSVRVSKGE
ncbi:hypothetical protein BN2476_230377 [Paraburkholderia piptadeniae]|uniref:Uncharacterized protein n=1 Tax=Paraburkholderia piptadeniae TaxID=1701573 RepID=A0A1N7RY75_9BURK|nr:hypothetical protein BN2476_230377 [Paraburkholderia piptadeniae]